MAVEVTKTEEGFQVRVGDRALRLTLEKTEDPDILVAHFGERPMNVILRAANSQSATISMSGEVMTFRKPQPATATPQTSPAITASSKDLTAPMPGRVITIMAKVGATVNSGDPLVVIESMKMETVIRSDRQAEVEKVLVEEGSAVRRGQPLVKFMT